MSVPLRNEQRVIVVALAGQPNVGKSTIFNLLTGLSQHVGNWPGKTVERKEGALVTHGDTVLRIADLPGTYGLGAGGWYDEQVTRDFIIEEHPDVIVMVADASSLERNLYLLAELLLLPAPVVLVLNMMDVAEAQGIRGGDRAGSGLGSARSADGGHPRNQGSAELVAAIKNLVRNPAAFHPARPQIAAPHRAVHRQVKQLLGRARLPPPYDPGLGRAESCSKEMRKSRRKGESLRRRTGVWSAIETQLRGSMRTQCWTSRVAATNGSAAWHFGAALIRPRLGQISLTDRLDRVAVHPLWGLLLLLSVFAAVFGSPSPWPRRCRNGWTWTGNWPARRARRRAAHSPARRSGSPRSSRTGCWAGSASSSPSCPYSRSFSARSLSWKTPVTSRAAPT